MKINKMIQQSITWPTGNVRLEAESTVTESIG